jgi:hypothetical protein
MAFDTPDGTRGARQPRAGMLMRQINKTMANRIRRTGKTMGFNALVLTTTGAKTGLERRTPIGAMPASSLRGVVFRPSDVQADYERLAGRGSLAGSAT